MKTRIRTDFFDSELAKKNIYLTLICFTFSCHISSFGQIHLQEKGILSFSEKEKFCALKRGFDSLRKKDYKEAEALVLEAIAIGERYCLQSDLAECYYRYSDLAYDLGKSDCAFENSHKALKLYKEQNNIRWIIGCYTQIGRIYATRKGNVPEGIRYTTLAIQLAEENGIHDVASILTNNIGCAFAVQKKYDKAIEYFEKAASLSKGGYAYALATSNIGKTSFDQGNLRKAEKYNLLSLKTSREIKDEHCIMTALGQLATLYISLNRLDDARRLTDELIMIQIKKGLEKDLMKSFNSLGDLFDKIQQYDSAIIYYNKSLAIAKKVNYSDLYFIYSHISDVYKKQGIFDKALENKIRQYQTKDSILSREQKLKIEELLVQFETEKREKEIEVLKKDQLLKKHEQQQKEVEYSKKLLEKTLAEQKSKNQLLHKNNEIEFLKKESELQKAKYLKEQKELNWQKLISDIIILAVVLICIPIICLIIVYRQKVRQKELLIFKTEEINKQKTKELMNAFELETIRANIKGQETERYRISRELREGVEGALSEINASLTSFSHSTENAKVKGIISSLKEISGEVKSISYNLTPPKINDSIFIDFVIRYFTDIAEAGDLEINFTVEGRDEFNRLSDDFKVEIFRILQELMNNSIKHANTKLMEIKLMKSNESIRLAVEDHGEGFNQTSVKNGIGLNNILRRIKTLGGELYITSLPGRGTLINIDILYKYPKRESKVNLFYENN